MEKNGKISWTEHNNKLRSAGNDWRRKSSDTSTKKERKEMEPRKRERKWNQEREKGNRTKKERKEMEPRKRERKWNQEREKGNGTKKERKEIEPRKRERK